MNIFSVWKEALVGSFKHLWNGLGGYLPMIVAAIIIFVVGWIVASLAGKLVAKLVRMLKVDDVLRGTEVERVINRAGFTLNIARFVGGLVEWFIIVAVFVSVFDVLQLTVINLFLLQVLYYVPNIIIAVVVIVIAAVVGEFLQKVVRGSAAAAGMKASTLVGSVAKWAIWIFAIFVAISQLGIASSLFDTLTMGIVVALAIAFGLAFGLGGQQAAAEIIAKVRKGLDTN